MMNALKKRIVILFLALVLALGSTVALPLMTVTVEAAQTTAKVKNGWVKKSGKWYYYRKGRKVKGWKKVKNKWYYLDKTSGVLQTGWKKVSGKWYYLRKKDGVMLTGWQKVNSKWYYMDKKSGAMQTGWLIDAGKTYYLNASGAMVTGLQTIEDRQYFFAKSGAMFNEGWKVLDCKLRYFGEDGVMTVNTTVTVDECACIFDAAGELTNRADLSAELLTKLAPFDEEAAKQAEENAAAEKAAAEKAEAEKAKATKGKYTAEFVMKNCGVTSAKRAQFVADIANAVVKYAPSYGIKVYSPVIAQAIHESAWGESTLGYKYHNYFGLKCGTAWTGKSVNVKTTEEYTVGTLTVIKDNFRVYDNLDQGVKGYFEFIQKDRYKNLKGVTSPKKYLENIKADGYATGSQYVTNTYRVITTYNLTIFDPKSK